MNVSVHILRSDHVHQLSDMRYSVSVCHLIVSTIETDSRGFSVEIKSKSSSGEDGSSRKNECL